MNPIFPHLEKTQICPLLAQASQQDIAAFEQEFTPQDKCVFAGSATEPAEYDFNSPADEKRAWQYSHGHFLLNRYLTALASHLRHAGISLQAGDDFMEYIWPQADEKLCLALQAMDQAAGQNSGFNMLDFANQLLTSASAMRWTIKGCR